MAASPAYNIDDFVEQFNPKIPAVIEFGRRLGAGGFGQVYLVEGVVGVAVKRILKRSKQEWQEQIEEARKEFNVLKKLNGEHFVTVYELRADRDRILIFMEYMPGGTLHDLIKNSPNGRLDEFHVVIFARQLLHAIQHMHKTNIMNRDLKPQNILLDSTKRHLKICDFGLAAELSSQRTHTALSTDCGTSRYMAPEIDRGEYGTKSELWSLGIILVEMNTGESIVTNLDDLLRDASKQLKDLISQLLVRDPGARPTATEALESALFIRTKYISHPYTGKKLFCSADDLDGIITMALDNELPIYALDPQEGK